MYSRGVPASEKQDLGQGDEARRNVVAAPHPAGVGRHLAARRLGEAERFEQLACALPRGAPREAQQTIDRPLADLEVDAVERARGAEALRERVSFDRVDHEASILCGVVHTAQRCLLLSFAGLSLLVATIAGAVGSHALSFADAEAQRSFETAVQFQFFHGLGVVAVTLVGLEGRAGRLRTIAAWLMLAGTVLFCGSIYVRALGGPGGIVAVAPYGGVAFMVSWLAFAASPWLRDSAR